MASQRQSKLRVYKEMKWEVGFKDYSKYVKRASSTVFCVSFWYSWVFKELGRDAKSSRSQ